MRLSLLVAVVAVVLFACPGPRKGPEANAIYFWQVGSSTLDWGECSDNEGFRQGAKPIDFSANSFIVYKVDATGKKATSQSCSSLSASACTDSSSGVVFDIAGSELTFTQQNVDPIGDAGCNLQQSQTWTFRDQIQKFDLEIDNVLSLTGDEAQCKSIEKNLVANSPNMKGVTGCVVTFKLAGNLR